ncbi:MAG TPA: N-carbamoylputrescine amidase [Firmicutes bacterium]|nr:N-carbamoylputrescine amidase [Bacillota bacterium]HBM70666.1 N-carbamoylputrescine amidase [Bacillota bacterium]HBX25029.1 N-carbamoylputrescine amidase [Bacillota bacterium]
MSVKVGLVQMKMSSIYEENIAKADHYIEKLVNQGAKLVLLPELFSRYYFCQIEDYEYFDFAETASCSKTLSHFQEVAKKYKVILPISFFEKDNNCYFNSLAMIDENGNILGIYRKSHIPTGECYEEKFYFTPGDTGFMVFDTSIGKIGVGICWDQWFPETARILALKGAEIILYPTAIGSEPVLDKDSKDHWQNVMKGHAASNIVPVLAANRIGKESIKSSSMTFFGSSFISDEYGNKVAELNRDEENCLVYEFDFEKINKERRDWGVFRDRRVDLYSDLLKLSSK